VAMKGKTQGIAVAVVVAVGLAGCSLTLPVTGQLQNSSETFEGSATGHLDRSGELTVTTSKGVQCNGTFVYVDARTGKGTFRCGDGRSGPFEFVSTGQHGTGQGDLGGEHFTFTFG